MLRLDLNSKMVKYKIKIKFYTLTVWNKILVCSKKWKLGVCSCWFLVWWFIVVGCTRVYTYLPDFSFCFNFGTGTTHFVLEQRNKLIQTKTTETKTKSTCENRGNKDEKPRFLKDLIHKSLSQILIFVSNSFVTFWFYHKLLL